MLTDDELMAIEHGINSSERYAAKAHDFGPQAYCEVIFARVEDARRLLAEVRRLREEVALDDKLIEERNRVLDAVLCPAHGRCVPHAVEEIARMREKANGTARSLYGWQCRTHGIGGGGWWTAKSAFQDALMSHDVKAGCLITVTAVGEYYGAKA